MHASLLAPKKAVLRLNRPRRTWHTHRSGTILHTMLHSGRTCGRRCARAAGGVGSYAVGGHGTALGQLAQGRGRVGLGQRG